MRRRAALAGAVAALVLAAITIAVALLRDGAPPAAPDPLPGEPKT